MSRLEKSVSSHDMFVGIALRVFLSKFGGDVVEVDGRVITQEHVRPFTSVVLGYRPDAVIQLNEESWMIEAKSLDDLYSAHSRKQYRIVSSLLLASAIGGFFLLIFGDPPEEDSQITLPSELQEFIGDSRLRVIQIPFGWRDYDDANL